MIALSELDDGGYFAEMISINQQSGQTSNSFNLPGLASSTTYVVRCFFFDDFFICSAILTEGSRHNSKTFDTIWEVNKPIPVVWYCLG